MRDWVSCKSRNPARFPIQIFYFTSQVTENLHSIKGLQDREQQLEAKVELLRRELESEQNGLETEQRSRFEAEEEILNLRAMLDRAQMDNRVSQKKIIV